jgi:hypothetical protein
MDNPRFPFSHLRGALGQNGWLDANLLQFRENPNVAAGSRDLIVLCAEDANRPVDNGVARSGQRDLRNPEDVVMVVALAGYRPVARLHLSTAAGRRGCAMLRAAFTAFMWRLAPPRGRELEAPLMPACVACGRPTGCFCDLCHVSLCTECDRDPLVVCAACGERPAPMDTD